MPSGDLLLIGFKLVSRICFFIADKKNAGPIKRNGQSFDFFSPTKCFGKLLPDCKNRVDLSVGGHEICTAVVKFTFFDFCFYIFRIIPPPEIRYHSRVGN